MSEKIVITCAVTGSGDTFRKNPAVPITPKQIATAALEAGRAGAAIAHIHVRDPETGKSSSEIALYREVMDRIRERDERLIIQLTCGDGGFLVPGAQDPAVAGEGTNFRTPASRVAHVEALRPDMCTLDMGTFNFESLVFVNTPDHVREMARRIRAAGTKPDLEVFELGHAVFVSKLIEEELFEAPVSTQLILGLRWGAPATARAVIAIRDLLPPGVHWTAAAGGDDLIPMAAQSVLLGGGVRVGLEDSLYIAPGVLAQSNAQQVEKAVDTIRLLGKEPASAAQAREILGLRPTNAS